MSKFRFRQMGTAFYQMGTAFYYDDKEYDIISHYLIDKKLSSFYNKSLNFTSNW